MRWGLVSFIIVNLGLFHITAFTACLVLPKTFFLSPLSLPKTKNQHTTYLVVSLAISLKEASSQYLFHYRQEERRRRSFQDYTGQKITLEAVLNTTCKKCGCKGRVKPLPFPRFSPCGWTLFWKKEAAHCEFSSSRFLAKWWPLLLFPSDSHQSSWGDAFPVFFSERWPYQMLYHYHHSSHPTHSLCLVWARPPWTMPGGVRVLDYE